MLCMLLCSILKMGNLTLRVSVRTGEPSDAHLVCWLLKVRTCRLISKLVVYM